MIKSDKLKAIANRLTKLDIKEKDLQEKFIRGTGKGGQKLNKTSSCVFLKHIPSGIQVKCSADRSREINRFLARRILAEKIEEKKSDATSKLKQKIHKLRKQKKRRSKKAKEKVLLLKKIQSEKKNLRKRPDIYYD